MNDNYQAVFDAVRSRFHFSQSELISEFCGRNDFSMHAELIKQEFMNVAFELQRPCVIFKPKITIDGDSWCAILGDDIQSGVCAFGNSPDEAMREFDKEWYKTMTKDQIVSESEKITCDKCGKDITAEWYSDDGRAGHCTVCGRNLCGLCSGNWRDIAEVERACADCQADAEVEE